MLRRVSRRNTGIVLPADLERPVTALANKIRESLVALYNLHTALLNSLGHTTPEHPLLSQFRSSRDTFRAECEKIVALLQHFYGHADDFVDLCQFMTVQSVAECIPLAEDSWDDAKNISLEVINIQKTYETWYRDLYRQRSKVVNSLTRTLPAYTIEPRSFYRRATLSSSARQFVDTVHNALYPNGPQSLEDSYAALEAISVALKDILVFWKGHTSFLEEFKSQSVASIKVDAVASATWKRYRSALLAAISSIYESSDAMSVDPVTASQPARRSGYISEPRQATGRIASNNTPHDQAADRPAAPSVLASPAPGPASLPLTPSPARRSTVPLMLLQPEPHFSASAEHIDQHDSPTLLEESPTLGLANQEHVPNSTDSQPPRKSKGLPRLWITLSRYFGRKN